MAERVLVGDIFAESSFLAELQNIQHSLAKDEGTLTVATAAPSKICLVSEKLFYVNIAETYYSLY